ncbi:MAG: hypothetical protein ACXACY_10360 [Candidatus Hodarchaeales archaeon]|jgi:hypothetical protein
MQCRNCNSQIPAAFKHALVKNECPVCGSQIMDEESLALIEDVSKTIISEATIREETGHHLATVLVARYNMSLGTKQIVHSQQYLPPSTTVASSIQDKFNDQAVAVGGTQNKNINVQSKVVRTAPPSTIQKLMNPQQQQIIKMPDIPEGVSDTEREKIFEKAVMEKYNTIDQIHEDDLNDLDDIDIIEANGDASNQTTIPASTLFTEGQGNTILEQERLARLAKQKQAMDGGGGGPFRRSG